MRPDLVPPVPKAERDALPRRELWLRFFKVVLPPLSLVLAVLGSIIGGVAAPTEAASMGALGSILVTAFARPLSLKVLRETVQATTKITADDDVHPDLRAGVLARLPRPARRGPDRGPVQRSCPAA